MAQRFARHVPVDYNGVHAPERSGNVGEGARAVLLSPAPPRSGRRRTARSLIAPLRLLGSAPVALSITEATLTRASACLAGLAAGCPKGRTPVPRQRWQRPEPEQNEQTCTAVAKSVPSTRTGSERKRLLEVYAWKETGSIALCRSIRWRRVRQAREPVDYNGVHAPERSGDVGAGSESVLLSPAPPRSGRRDALPVPSLPRSGYLFLPEVPFPSHARVPDAARPILSMSAMVLEQTHERDASALGPL